ncbi:hypothetical protein ACLB2K_067226 [Fragaria x ananassa]
MTLMLLWLVTPSTETVAPSEAPPVAKPNCQSVCGGVSIPYPFGIGPKSDCYLEEWYEIECNNATSPHKPFLKHTNPSLEVLNISINGNLHVNSHVTFFYEGGPQTQELVPNLTGSPFVYSQQGNRFIAASCGYFALVKSDPDQRIVGGCMSTCDQGTWSYGSCLGINCCQTTLPQYLTVISSELRSESGENITKSQLLFANYNYVFLVDQAWLENNSLSIIRTTTDQDRVPVMLEWSFVLDLYNTPYSFLMGKKLIYYFPPIQQRFARSTWSRLQQTTSVQR